MHLLDGQFVCGRVSGTGGGSGGPAGCPAGRLRFPEVVSDVTIAGEDRCELRGSVGSTGRLVGGLQQRYGRRQYNAAPAPPAQPARR